MTFLVSNPTMKLVERKIFIYEISTLPFGKRKNSILPSADKVSLKLPNNIRKSPFDIGSWVYTERVAKTLNTKSSDYGVILVNPSTLREERQVAIKNLLESLYIDIQLKKTAYRSINSYLTEMRFFIDWCDQNNHQDLFLNTKKARLALLTFIEFLRERLKVSKQYGKTTHDYQQRAIKMVSQGLDINEPELMAGIRQIFPKTADKPDISLRPEAEFKTVLCLSDKLFHGLCDFLIEEKHYPFLLDLPKESVWVFPLYRRPFFSKEKLKDKNENIGLPINFEEGQLKNLNEIISTFNSKLHGKKSRASLILDKAKSKLQEANSNKWNSERVYLANWCIESFIVLFLSRTGMNEAQLVTQQWDKNHIIGDNVQGFKNIKPRAGGKFVEFKIQSRFINQFRKFIKFRAFLLEDNDIPNLFFTVKGKNQFIPFENKVLDIFYGRLHAKIDSTIPVIKTKEWRDFKVDNVLKENGPIVTASTVQNTTETLIKYYVKGRSYDQQEQFTAYFHKLNNEVIFEDKHQWRKSAVGHCKTNGENPTSNLTNMSVNPDCNQPEGCLFCIHYAVHADEEDIRKLCSIRYVISHTINLSANIEHNLTVFKAVLQRIEDILQALSARSSKYNQLVENISNDVEKRENLSQYWAQKLYIFKRLEVLV